MENNIIVFKNRTYTLDSETGQVSLVTASGNKVPVTLTHPSVAGLREAVVESVADCRLSLSEN